MDLVKKLDWKKEKGQVGLGEWGEEMKRES